MKVKEIAQVFNEYSDFFVVQNGKYLPGDRTSFF
ncbi:phage protein [Streptococcus dysgalactiae subsp. dysgalactiae ATCC 27957]|nr:phage protein [Streptococcus dysgalactiae subsp. dysgalactiae ATCC 27957]